MRLGYEDQTAHVFEGSALPQYAVWPAPMLSLAKLAEEGAETPTLPSSLHGDPTAWLFREDAFESVTRVRRGRLYQPDGNSRPTNVLTAGHPLVETAATGAWGTGRHKSLYTYMPCQDLLNRADRGHGAHLVIGMGAATTLWRVILVERAISGDVVVTLKSKSAFGVLPEVAWASVPDEARVPVRQALERVLDSAFRETPISVIDQCRNAATVVLTHWLASEGKREFLGKDLAEAAKAAGLPPAAKQCASWIGQTLARLHVRGKSNEQANHGLRTPVEEDAELAVHGLGFLIREVGWAAS